MSNRLKGKSFLNPAWRPVVAGIAAVAALAFSGCESEGWDHGKGMADTQKVEHRAQAVLSPSSGSQVRGTVDFIQDEKGVRVEASITGLSPGLHGFHIHEKGDCSAPDGSSAGGHFNPTGASHGSPDVPSRHLGDLGNIEADSSGTAHYSRIFYDLTFEGANSILGKAVIVHGNVDDLTSQPSGNSGPRVACGMIEKKPESVVSGNK